MKNSDLANALWQGIVAAYSQGGRTKVELPYEDVLHVLASLQANVISQVPVASERTRLLRAIGPDVDAMLRKAMEKPHNHIASRGSGLVLPG